jgi:hypothetical protein
VILVLLVMLGIVLLAVSVVAYVAYPHRAQRLRDDRPQGAVPLPAPHDHR